MNNYCVTIFRVHYAETDQMGIAHHSNYFIWFEAGRSDLCRSWGIPYGHWEASGVMLPLVGGSLSLQTALPLRRGGTHGVSGA